MILYTAERLAEMLGVQNPPYSSLCGPGSLAPRSTWRANTW